MRSRSAIVEGMVLERGEIEIGAELAIDAGEQIEIELRGDAVGIVIGAIENIGRLDEIDADDEHATRRPASARHGARKAAASCGSKLPMVEPGKKPDARHRRKLGRQLGHRGEIRDHRIDRKMRQIAAQLCRILLQEIAGNIDRHIGLDARRGAAAECALSGSTRRRIRSKRNPAETARPWPAHASAEEPSSLRVG